MNRKESERGRERGKERNVGREGEEDRRRKDNVRKGREKIKEKKE